MNILAINTVHHKGGAARIARDLETGLKQAGHTVSFFAGSSSPMGSVVTPTKPLWERAFHKIFPSDCSGYNTAPLLNQEAFRSADLVHCHNLGGSFFHLPTLLKLQQNKPLVWTLHDMWPMTTGCPFTDNPLDSDGFYPSEQSASTWQEKLVQSHQKNIKAKTYKELQATIVSCSKWMEGKVRGSVLGKQSGLVIHNGIDLDVFAPVPKLEARKALNLPLDRPILLFISAGGKQDLRKGWKYIEAAQTEIVKQYPNVLFVNIGGNPDPAGDPPHLLSIPYVSDSSILAKYYSASDAFLFSSLAENMPLVTLEALGCGVPIVSFNVGGIPEEITHLQHGYIAPLRDTDEFIKGIRWALTLTPGEREELTQRSRAHAEANFSRKLMVDRYTALYTELLQKRRS